MSACPLLCTFMLVEQVTNYCVCLFYSMQHLFIENLIVAVLNFMIIICQSLHIVFTPAMLLFLTNFTSLLYIFFSIDVSFTMCATYR